MATSRSRSARGPGVLLVAATGLAAAAVALDAGFNLPAALRAVLFAAWAAAVGVLAWGALGRSARRQREAWVAGGAAVAAFGLLVVLVPGGARAGRLAPPWSAAPPAVRLTVTTGDPLIARGAGVTVACVCDRRPDAEFPPVWLEVRDESGEVRAIDPAEEAIGVLSSRLPVVLGPLAYRFVGDGAATAWYRITPADPVALTPASSLTASPPAYADGVFSTRRFAPGEPVSCLVGGRVAGRLVFDRTAAEVRAVWTTGADEPDRPLSAMLAADRRSATLTADIPATGRVLLTLTGDDGYRSVVDLPVTAVADRPPEFVVISGFDGGKWSVRADEAFTVSVEVQDDYWAAAPTLHLLIGEASQTAMPVPVPLTALSGGRFTGRLTVAVADRWANGRVVCRLRLADSLRPDGVLFPLDGWAEFVRTESAAPLAEQIVLAQRDRVTGHLTAALDTLTRDRRDPDGTAARHLTEARAVVRHVDQLDMLTEELRVLTASITRPDHAGVRESLSAAQELNRRLAVVRLDRLRLLALAATVRQQAGHAPNAEDAARLRDRLAAVTAASPRLSAARSAADRRAVTDAVADAGRLADELDRAADRVLAEQATTLRPLHDRADELATRLNDGEAKWATAARLTGPNRPSVELLRRAAAALQNARPVDALPALDAAARQLADLSAAFTQAAEARGDPREAARQLVRWRADLDARPGPPPADELNRWHACARELAAIARRHDPTGGDTPERIAHAFPPPTELKRAAAQTLREVAASAATARQPSEFTALVERLESLPPPAETRHSRLAAAVAKRTATDLTAGQSHDATAGATELRWRAELLAQPLAGDGNPLAVLEEAASTRTAERLGVLALRVGLPPDLGGDFDAVRVAVRARLDGTDTDRQRVGNMARWWSSRTAISPEHVRDLVTLLDTIRVGDNPQPLADVVRTLRTAARTPSFKTEVATTLGRLREGLGRAADATLAAEADLDRPTAAQRLIAFDSGDRLPGRSLAEAAGKYAEQVRTLAKEVADTSAKLHAAENGAKVRSAVAAELDRIGSVFRRHATPEAVATHWQNIGHTWNKAGDIRDTLRATATALRQLGGLTRPVTTSSDEELAIGRKLLEAEQTLVGDGQPGPAFERAARAIESAAR